MVLALNLGVGAACFALAWFTLEPDRTAGVWLLRKQGELGDSEEMRLGKRQILLLSLCLAVCAAAVMVRISAQIHDGLNWTKMALAMLCLTGSACVDFTEHRIPNLFPGSLSVGAIVLLSAGVLSGQNGAIAYVASSVFAAVVTTACLLIASLLSHHGVGAGDIKLLGSLALLGGVNLIGGTVFFAMLLCSAAAAVLLISKKKTIKQAIPFGPFVLFGYMLAVCTIPF